MAAIKVLVVDDNTLVRRGIAAVFAGEERLQVVGEASDGFEAMEKARETHPDVVLMDLMMPNCGGLEATAAFRTGMPEINILILTVSEQEADLFAAINAGAKGYLLKNTEPEELILAIFHIAKGGVIVSAPMAENLLREFKGSPSEGHSREEAETLLSKREYEVLQLVAQGASNKQIGFSLVISENTVKTHLRVIMDKLHLVNRSQAAAYAIRSGITHERRDPAEAV